MNNKKLYQKLMLMGVMLIFNACTLLPGGSTDVPPVLTDIPQAPTDAPAFPTALAATTTLEPAATLAPTDFPAPTATTAPTEPPPPTATEAPATPVDVTTQIETANILVYEDTFFIGLYIQETLDGMELSYTHVGDQVGDLLTELNSGTEWDLIIIGGEGRAGVQGEFWDVIIPFVVEHDTALILETWTLNFNGNGKVRQLLAPCGVTFQKNFDLAVPLYAVDPAHPVFNTPNVGVSLERYIRFWNSEAGDLLELTTNSTAEMLLTTVAGEDQRNGVAASCFDGRVIIQTFSNHDYRKQDVMLLWENYIIYTLTNHFNAAP